MKLKACFTIFCVFLFSAASLSQSCPPNIDFESGTFANWQCYTGNATTLNGQNVINLLPSGPVANRHEIISATTPGLLDPYGLFPKLCPYGGAYSVKLGNNSTGGQAEGLSYTFTVPPGADTFTFTYFYAVVFQDPNHSPFQQPRFFVTAYEVASGNPINCSSFDYVANGGIPGFVTSTINTTVLYKNWSPAALQFSGRAGRQVRLEFKTADCTRGGHFGYAYLDVGSGCSNIMATAPYCAATNSLILNAPYGFQNYVWYDNNYSTVLGNQQSVILSPAPVTSGIFHVVVIPFPGYGCRDTMHTSVKPFPVPDTPVAQSLYSYCQNKTATRLTATALQGYDLLWYATESGGAGSATAPVPLTTTAGIFAYYVCQKVLFGCESVRKKIIVEVLPVPVVSFSINSTRQCQNLNDYLFTSTTSSLNNCVYEWDFGNGQSVASASDSAVHRSYSNAGIYTVKLKVTNSGNCFSENSMVVTVAPNPIASFTYPANLCEKQTALSIVNTSFVAGVAVINKWWWSINGVIENTLVPAATPPNLPGPLQVKLVVTTSEGCNSDTSTVILPVHYRPGASFRYSNLLCENSIVQFTDLSTMPPGASPEMIVKRYWQFDNGNPFEDQHPSGNFNAGMHHARLITETNSGCRSAETDSVFEIYKKPQIQVDVNDSCVFRSISFLAKDILTIADTWFWNFGNGFKKDNSLVSRSYNRPGDYPFTLMGVNIHGCRDTMYRPFTIYDNKAFAGRDTVAAWNEPVQLNAHGGAGVTYLWTPSPGLDNPLAENPIATLAKDQLYQLDAMSDKGCDARSKIFIRRYKGPELYIPSGFTPDGDGLNDVLKVFPVGIKQFIYFTVYNRYGQRIFYTDNSGIGWDGKLKGNPVPSGAYVAVASAVDYRGNSLTNRMAVTLVR